MSVRVCMHVCVCVCMCGDTHKLFVIQGGPGGQRVGESSFPGLYHGLKTKGVKYLPYEKIIDKTRWSENRKNICFSFFKY